ncbi:MAG: protein kinase [Deltaproteobacteria bacterium]|nr:protein kinase [Deltaproteobacteria bacterium]
MTQVIGDRFEIERLVGSGGMGEVFRAKDRLTGGAVAIKVLHASSRDEERFRREGQILAEISHPRIVKYVAHGLADAKRPFIAMEWLDGEDLGERLARSGLTLHETLTLARRVAEGLAVLHDRGVVHRDIKPSNIFLPNRSLDQVKLLDLGVARLIHASQPSTRSGVMVGTPGYMAPEQARGHREIDTRADVFAMGCVLYECLAGRPVFAGDNIAALLAKILLETPAGLRESGIEIPAALDDLVTRMLSKHVTARPTNGSAVLRELDQFRAVKDSPAQRASQPPMRALTGSERRLVCVVMASTTGEGEVFSELAPHETIAAAFDPRTVVASFGADAEILADGSVVVTLTGKGGASEQAAQAARCALALRSHLVSARVALATGLATATGKSYVGEVIERAAEILAGARVRTTGLSEETQHGQSPVFLDETTAGLLDMRFDVGGDERGLFIRGLRERESRPRTLLGKPTPFVGRDRELATLIGIFEECMDEPVARAVIVTGQPGAGKSRMGAEFLRRASELDGVEVWLARGDPMSDGSPFSLLARMIRRTAGITGAEPLVVRQQKLRARVGRHVHAEDVGRVAEFVGEIASVHFHDTNSLQLRAARQDAILMGDQMRRAFCDFVLAEAAAGPLLVVLEDLHWGDLPSVSFIDSALRDASEKPLLVLALARGEVHESFPNLWEQRSVQEIRLGPLVRRAGERLVREVLGDDLPPAECARLLDRAAGNVFYLEELIRAYAEGTGRVLSSRDVSGSTLRTGTTAPPPASPSGTSLDVAAWSLPGTVLAMVEARLERLDPMARRVLRAASLFGEVFWRGGLLALTGGDYKASEVDDWLSDLVRREIVQRRDVSRFPSDHEYQFRHALVRDAAYQMLTQDDRMLGHKLAGEWLEKAGEHDAMMLAEHFERGCVLDKASRHFARAAEQALEGNDFGAARIRVDRAIASGARGAVLGKLELLAAEASRWAGEHDVALQHARCAMKNLDHGGDDWHHAVAEAAEAAMTLGHSVEADELAQRIRELEVAPGKMTPARVVAMARIASRLVVAGSVESAQATVSSIERDAAAIVAESAGAEDAGKTDPAARGFLLSARVGLAMWRGDLEQAAGFSEEASRRFAEVGDVRNAARMDENAGFAWLQLGAFHRAEIALKEALASATRLGLVTLVNQAKLHLGQLYSRMLRREESVSILTEAIRGFSEQQDRVGEGCARVYLAGVSHLHQEHGTAAEAAEASLPFLQSSPPYRAGVLGLLSLMRVDDGDAEGAYAAGVEAMKILQTYGGSIEGEAIIHIGYAEGLRAKNDIEGSKAAIAAARDRLLARARKIENPELRKGFMENLKEHQRILLRAGEWLA